MFRYFDFAIKYIIRRVIRMVLKPKVLLIIAIILLFSFLVLNMDSYAVYVGDNTYTDKNNTISMAYESLNSDLINRLANCTSSVNILLNKLKDSNFSYYLFYGSNNGSSMINASTFQTSRLYIAFYNSNATTSPTVYDNFLGMVTNIYNVTIDSLYYFEDNDIFSMSDVSSVLIPNVLINYKSDVLVDYINNSSQQQTDSLKEAIQDTTNSVNQLENTIKEQDEEKSSSDINSSFESVSSSTSEFDSDVNSIVDFFKSLHEVIQEAIDKVGDDVLTVSIGLPFVDKSITLKSDIIYNAIYPSVLFTLLQLSYVVAFGYYIIISAFNVIEWVVSGEMITGVKLQHKNLILNTLFK